MVFPVYSYHLYIIGNDNREIFLLPCQTWFGAPLVGISIIQSLFPFRLGMLQWMYHLEPPLQISAVFVEQDKKSETKFSEILIFVF